MSDRKVTSDKKMFQRSSSAAPLQRNDGGQNPTLLRARSKYETQLSRTSRSASVIALEEFVQCGICIDKLSEPRMLPCQHTFCLSCLKAHLVAATGKKLRKKHTLLSQEEIEKAITEADNDICCPTCQIPARVGKGFEGLQQLPTNVYIDSLLKLLESNNSIPETSTRCSAEVRCVKCQTVCEFKEENCGHCKQIFCKVCWMEHLSTLKGNLFSLIEHLRESEIHLQHRMRDFHERCDKLGLNIKRVTEEKISEITEMQQTSLKQVENIKKQEDDTAKALRDQVSNIKKEIERATFASIPDDKQKVDIFMNFHRETSKVLNEISNLGELRLIFDPKTYKIKQNNESLERGMSAEESDSTDGTITQNPLENVATRSAHYLTRTFIPKLVWTKCPRPAGLGIPPWAPDLLYIAATDRKVVLIMDRKMCKVTGKLFAPDMLCPNGVAFCKRRLEIYVSDKWKHCIHVFSNEGEHLRILCSLGSGASELRSPEGIAINQRNELVVCDVGNDRVIILDPVNGRHVSTLGLYDKRTELQTPTGVTVHEDKIIIADNGNHRVKVYSITGKRILEFGSLGSNKGQFRNAEVVACDPSGFILVGDAGNARIQVFQPDGKLVRVIGGYGETPGKFAWVSGLLVTPQLEIIVTDYKNRRLQIF